MSLAASGSSCHTIVMAVLSSPKPSLASPTCEPISYQDGRVLWGHTLVPAEVLSSPEQPITCLTSETFSCSSRGVTRSHTLVPTHILSSPKGSLAHLTHEKARCLMGGVMYAGSFPVFLSCSLHSPCCAILESLLAQPFPLRTLLRHLVPSSMLNFLKSSCTLPFYLSLVPCAGRR